MPSGTPCPFSPCRLFTVSTCAPRLNALPCVAVGHGSRSIAKTKCFAGSPLPLLSCGVRLPRHRLLSRWENALRTSFFPFFAFWLTSPNFLCLPKVRLRLRQEQWFWAWSRFCWKNSQNHLRAAAGLSGCCLNIR